MQGFLRGCPAKQWKIFLPVELQIVIQGHTEFDWNLLEKVLDTSTYFCHIC